MATIYSTRFYAAVGLSPGTYVAYTVPAGYVVVVRDIDAYSSAGISDAEIYFRGALTQTFYYGTVAAGSKDTAQWRGRQVFDAGDELGIEVGGASDWDVTVSGYLLTAP